MIEDLKPYQFKPGQSGNPGGYPKGVKQLREMALEAYFEVFERLGGVDGLLEWVKASPKYKQVFYSWLVALMPREIKGEGFENRIIVNNITKSIENAHRYLAAAGIEENN